MNISLKGKNILKKLANDENMINYNNLFLEQVILILLVITILRDSIHCMTY